ncbi:MULTISPECIES: formyltransferase family protein [Spirulina sp. CCY15215]|uniref:formyltransferase family protein n=1 Tax=Spirulina sp. CCY15215 TaxID=2767591 RepID=UPI001950BC07
MNIILLTTNTSHHLYYAWKITERFSLKAIFLETSSVQPPFETYHPFEKLQTSYEKETLLSQFNSDFADLAETYQVKSINDSKNISILQSLKPDLVLVFGTRKLSKSIIQLANRACLNLHGGNPEYYRGLDTHLWSIYHNDFNNLVTTLHHVDLDLDTGEIVFQAQLKPSRKTHLYELRTLNTEVCVNLSMLAIHTLNMSGFLPSRKQLARGRYYSFMPSLLKEDCVKKFNRYLKRLP